MPAISLKRSNLYDVLASLSSLFIFSISMPLFATPDTWQGPYVGAFVGGGFGNSHSVTTTGSVTNTSYFSSLDDINAVNQAGTWMQHPNGVIGGIQAGHNWVWNQLVFGGVIDYGSFQLRSSSIKNNAYPDPNNAPQFVIDATLDSDDSDSSDSYSINTSIQTNWLYTLRGRVGAQPPMLKLPGFLYFTGGMAMTQLKVSNAFGDTTAFEGNGGSNTTQNQIGWTAGVGLEMAIFNHASVNFEYLYVEIPSVTTTGSIANQAEGFGIPIQSLNSPISTVANFNANLFKIGLNYRFDER